MEEANLVAVAPQPEPVAVTVPPVARDGAVVLWYAQSACPPVVSSVTLPDRTHAECLMREARLAVVRIVRRDAKAPGRKSPCWSYVDPATYLTCLDQQARTLPRLSYGHSGIYVEGFLAGKPWRGCAAGTGDNPIFVSLADPARVWSLHAWEASNEYLLNSYDRLDLTDGATVSEATNYAVRACGVN